MMTERHSQSILVSGESGAGKVCGQFLHALMRHSSYQLFQSPPMFCADVHSCNANVVLLLIDQTETTKYLLQYFAAMGEDHKAEGNVHNQVH